MKPPDEFARELGIICARHGIREGKVAAAIRARDAEVRAAALAEALKAAYAVARRRHPNFDRIPCMCEQEVAHALIMLVAASTPKPPESADTRCADSGVHGRCELHAGHDGSHRNGEWTWTLLPSTGTAPPKGEAPKAKCRTCAGEKWCWRCGRCGHQQPDTYDQGCDKCYSDNIAVMDPCPTCRGTGDAP